MHAICMEKIIIRWSDCESWGANAPPAPLAQPPLFKGNSYNKVTF